MLTTGTDSNWPFVELPFCEESGGIGYQSTLDALLKPSDDSFWVVCRTGSTETSSAGMQVCS
jgi:hypothetical protein